MLNPFVFREGVLFCDEAELALIADAVGTPCYVYSASAILDRYHAFTGPLEGLPHRICYAVKANGNLSLLRLLAQAGAGFDIVSGGELHRVLAAGGDPSTVVFSGVGKTREEIEFALESGILAFNCESETEVALISSLALRLGCTASVALRVNPDVDAATHPYISTGLKEHKFGIAIQDVEQVYERMRGLPGIELEGVSCHIGSQLLDLRPVLEAAERLLQLVDRLRARGLPIRHLDLGGGVGVPYREEDPRPDLAGFLTEVRRLLEGLQLQLILEPGRFLVAEAGALLSRVLYRKTSGAKEFVIVDASMTELIRPALYDAYHQVLPLRQAQRGEIVADVVGPVCESSDFLALDRRMANVLPGDLVAVMTAGAYGMAAASNYNARPRPAEVLVEKDAWRLIRRRETVEDLLAPERLG